MSSCKATRQGDQVCCGTCGLQWDVGDPDRPPCNTDNSPEPESMKTIPATRTRAVGLQALHDMRQQLNADVVHRCGNCAHNKTHYCEREQWTSGPGVDRDALSVLMNVENSKCAVWELKV